MSHVEEKLSKPELMVLFSLLSKLTLGELVASRFTADEVGLLYDLRKRIHFLLLGEEGGVKHD